MWSDIFQTEKPGYYGQFGGMFIPEILRATFEELIAAFESAKTDPTEESSEPLVESTTSTTMGKYVDAIARWST